jgi:PBP1b-binding outer membrane lipoprotein LpoB
MKKIVCLTGLILLVTLLLCGCANQQPQEKTDNAQPEETASEVPTESGTDLPDQQDTTDNVSSVTQEELDKLKADIERLEAEDLGGLSSE